MSSFDPTLGAERFMGLVQIIAFLIFIGLSWWALQEFRFDVLLRRPKSAQSKLLQVFLSIALSYQLTHFFMEYLQFSLGLQRMF